MKPETQIRKKALEAGFDDIGFTHAARIPPKKQEHFLQFLTKGWHGDMGWMEAKAERRLSPLNLWDEARGIIMLGQNYGPDHDPMENLKSKGQGNISVYARGRDYHDLVKKRLKSLGRWVHETFETPIKVFVDTAPVMEKPLAEVAGIGWQGKHTNLVSRKFGSWLFLGAIFTTLNLAEDIPHKDDCGSCRACLDICPTEAFPAPYKLDARRCISYLTVEHKGPIPHEFRKPMGNRIYGCDDCLAVCPWNKFAKKSRDLTYFAREDLKSPPLEKLLELDDAAFRKLFSKSPVKRTGRDRFIRNVLIAAGNSENKTLLARIETLLGDTSPLVRGAASWAFQQLAPETEIQKKKETGLRDSDPLVREEWARV